MRIMIRNYKVKSNFDKRIVLLSDIHYFKNMKKLFPSLVRKTSSLSPDIICISGDLFDRADVSSFVSMEPFYEFLRELGRICPTYLVLGNHDIRRPGLKGYSYFKDAAVLKEIRKIPNVLLLENESVSLDGICITGYDAPFSYYMKNELDTSSLKPDIEKQLSKNDDPVGILLLHTPIGIPFSLLKEKGYQYVLSGHTHNGMVPGFIKRGSTGIVSPAKRFFPKMVRGMICRDGVSVIVSGGVTKLSYSSGNFRFFNFLYASEITVLDFKKS